VRRRQPCIACETPTRRTVRVPEVGRSERYVVCSRCELPSAEARLLLAIYNVATLPALEAKAVAS
jgi:hypothetical protein